MPPYDRELVFTALHRYAVDEFGQVERLLGVRRDRRARAWLYLIERSDLSAVLSAREQGPVLRAALSGDLEFYTEWTPYWFASHRAADQDVIYCDSFVTAIRFARLRRLLLSRRGLDSLGYGRMDRIIEERAKRYIDRCVRRLASRELDEQAQAILFDHLDAGNSVNLYRQAATGNQAAERARLFLKRRDRYSGPIVNRMSVAWLRPRCARIEAEARVTPGVAYRPASDARRLLRWQ